jgi:hypothetical protein
MIGPSNLALTYHGLFDSAKCSCILDKQGLVFDFSDGKHEVKIFNLYYIDALIWVFGPKLEGFPHIVM